MLVAIYDSSTAYATSGYNFNLSHQNPTPLSFTTIPTRSSILSEIFIFKCRQRGKNITDIIKRM